MPELRAPLPIRTRTAAGGDKLRLVAPIETPGFKLGGIPDRGMEMKKPLTVLGFVCLAAALASAQETSRSEHGDRSLLIALENSWNQAQLHHNSKALDDLVADTFSSTDNDGVLQNKAEFLADNRDLSYAATVMANSDERVFFYDNTAVVAGVYHAKNEQGQTL